MLYEQVKKLKPTDFRRLTGIKLETFAVMIEVLKEAEVIVACGEALSLN